MSSTKSKITRLTVVANVGLGSGGGVSYVLQQVAVVVVAWAAGGLRGVGTNSKREATSQPRGTGDRLRCLSRGLRPDKDGDHEAYRLALGDTWTSVRISNNSLEYLDLTITITLSFSYR